MSKIDLHKLVCMLSAEAFSSGEEISNHFGVSRTAVSKQLKQLQEAGLDLFSVNRRGYKLHQPLELYDEVLLKQYLLNSESDLLEILFVTNSTNDHVKENVTVLSDGHVCIAEAQKSGKGRQGKSWFSPFGANVYLSMKWGFSQGFQSLSGLSLAIGVCLLRIIRTLVDSPVTLKWPNDVYVAGQKVAGILIEVSGNQDGSCDAIVGVGINLNMPNADDIDQPWTDIARHATRGRTVTKNHLVAELINELRKTLDCFASTGLESFLDDWEAHDHFIGQPISLLIGKKELKGIARGISETGALLVDIDENGNTVRKSFFGGEISVRAN